MEILFTAGCPYEDDDRKVLNLHVRLDDGETINVNDEITIELMDDSFAKAEVKIINPKYAGDYAYVSKKTTQMVQAGEYGMSDKRVMSVSGPSTATLVIYDFPRNEAVKTPEAIESRQLNEEIQKKICVTPYKEIHCGDESIYDFVQADYTVPERVINYLRTTQPFLMGSGVYNHPFKPEIELLGPYTYTDGLYYWDRDTWKYVVKYHVMLPAAFVDHVMSEEGKAYLDAFYQNPGSWNDAVNDWKNQADIISLLPEDTGDMELDNF